VRVGKTLFVMAMTAVLLGALVGAASARNLSISSQPLRATFTRINFSGGFGTSECRVTVEGSFHARTISKVANTLSGFITRAIVENPCIRGTATVLTETLPWHVRYQGFTGSLPSISTIFADVSSPTFSIREPFGISCLASGGIPRITFTREAGGVVSGVDVSGTTPTNCGPSGTFSSSGGRAFVLSTTTAIAIRLI
jgi:hypothetical protein